MTTCFVRRTTAFGLAAFFTFGILASIDVLSVQPAEQGVMAAQKAASQVARSAPAAGKHTGG